jgi:hypothetical protein
MKLSNFSTVSGFRGEIQPRPEFGMRPFGSHRPMRPSWVRGDQHEPFQVEPNCSQSDPIRSWTHEHSGAGMLFTWLLGPQDTGNW